MRAALLALALACLTALPALAAPLRWDVPGTAFGPGTIGGSFVFDAATGTYSDIALTATGIGVPYDGLFDTAIATPLSPFGGIGFVQSAVGSGLGAPQVTLGFGASLDAPPGAAVPLGVFALGVQTSINGQIALTFPGNGSSGPVGVSITTPIPLPAPGVLLFAGLGVLACRRLRAIPVSPAPAN